MPDCIDGLFAYVAPIANSRFVQSSSYGPLPQRSAETLFAPDYRMEAVRKPEKLLLSDCRAQPVIAFVSRRQHVP